MKVGIVFRLLLTQAAFFVRDAALVINCGPIKIPKLLNKAAMFWIDRDTL